MKITAEFFAGQAFYSAELHDLVMQQCDWSQPSTLCKQLVQQMNDEIGSYYVYNVYDTCGNDQLTLLDYYPEHPDGGWVAREFNPNWYNGKRADFAATAAFRRRNPELAARDPVSPMGALNDYPCGGSTVMTEYLALKEVQEAIHVKTDVPHFPFNYTQSEKNLLPAYPGFIEKYRVLIYSGASRSGFVCAAVANRSLTLHSPLRANHLAGNVDACIPWPGTERWTTGLGMKKVDAWRPWNYTGHHGVLVGGYVTLYEDDFAFLTVKGRCVVRTLLASFRPNPWHDLL